MTGKELAEFALSKIGTPYVYGMKGSIMTLEKYNQLKRLYGDLVWNSDKQKVGKVCCDCSGLISWYTGKIKGSSQYKAEAKNVHSISTIKDAPIGALVWKPSHIGIYIGMINGVPYYVAEDGSAYGCRKAKVVGSVFTHWFLCNDVTYTKSDFYNSTKGDELDMNKEDVIKLIKETINKEVKKEEIYDWTTACPEWGIPTVQKLLDKGLLKGDEEGKLGLEHCTLRVLVILDRQGIFDK